MTRAFELLSGCDLIFFDPDNGLDVPSVQRGRRNSSKYVYRSEVSEAYQRGHSVLVYQHFTRENRDTFLDRICDDLKDCTGATDIEVFRTPHVAFLLLEQPTPK